MHKKPEKIELKKIDKVNLERRYIAIGFFMSFFLFRQKMITPYLPIKGVSNVFISVFKIILKSLKFLVWKTK